MKLEPIFIACIALVPCAGYSQASHPDQLQIVQSLPSAPMPQTVPSQIEPRMVPNEQQRASGLTNLDSNSLSLKQAEALALKNNPQISVARLTALASQQVTREVRSNLWPTATGNLTGVDSQDKAASLPADSTTRSFINVPPLGSR